MESFNYDIIMNNERVRNMIQFKSNLNIKNEKTNLVVGVFSDTQHSIVSQLDKALNKRLSSALEQKLIPTQFKDVTPLYPLGQIESQKVYLVGLGKSTDFNVEKCRQVIGNIAKVAKEDVTILLETFDCKLTSINELATICAEAITLATYKMENYKTEEKPSSSVDFYIHCDSQIEEDLKRGIVYGEATNSARQLLNEPGNKLTATDLANIVAEFATEHNLEIRIVEKEEMEQLGMGGILGVNKGSVEPPKMIVAKYQGTPRFENITALVGKGLTFDTGGYCLKPRAGMENMKSDMGGAASAFGAFQVAVRLNLPVNLLLVIPSTDNMISGDAIKPGDILKTMNGKTVEVTNTDAEGRLILADGITFAKHLGASRIIDLATLTGAIVAALGTETTGAFTNNQSFYNEFIKAADLTNEYVWQMPLHPRDQKALRCSEVADLNNAPLGKPGAIMAAAFLKEFVEETPWIHLDIAGTADIKSAHDLGPKGGTGVMVRTIAKFLELQA